MWFGILGPLLVHDGNAVVTVPAARQRVLLAVLLANAGSIVPADALGEMVWDGAPPAGAAGTLRSHVMRLRRVLGPQAGARIVTRYPGYAVDAAEQEVDLLRFTRLCREGGSAVRDGAWDRAWGMLDEALALWRGEPLTGVACALLCRDEVPRLEQLRLQALEWRADAGLHLGRHAELAPELQALAMQHPLRERFHAQLMLALYRCDRQAEALAAYQHARRILVDELGAEPGPQLRGLQNQILTADPSLAAPRPEPRADSGSAPVVPRELPAGVRHFTGRARELATLTGLLDQYGGQTPGMVISAIGGTAGVGKTAVAVHWAHQVADRFPDGQLYVHLRGCDPGPPMTAADALARFLRALGVSGQNIPPEADERADLYRSNLAGRRMLVVLDNAESAEQVRPLLPGTPACTVVVTSRDALAGLVARDGAHRLDLDLLPLGDAVRLLRELIGERADVNPDTAATLAGQCCRLPLALRVAAELAAARPDASLADLIDELADQQRRLDLLDAGGDPRTALRAVFSWSYRNLEADTARAFRLLGLHPGPDFDPYAAAAVTGATLKRANHLLGMLAGAHLVEPIGQGRYRFHDLLRAYARELAIAQDSAQVQRETLSRLFDYYLYTAAAAMDIMFPAESDRRPRIPRPATPCPAITSIAAAQAWLDTERATLAAVAAHTATCGWPGHATRLAATLFRYLERGGHYAEIIAIHDHAWRAARETGDRAAEAEALQGLIVIDLRQGRYQQAADRLQQALAAYRETGNQAGEARTLGNLGIAGFLQGRYQQAADHLQQALAAYRETGNQVGEARHLSNLALVELRLGTYRQASQHLDRALTICRDTGSRSDEAYALSNLGVVSLRLVRQHPFGV